MGVFCKREDTIFTLSQNPKGFISKNIMPFYFQRRKHFLFFNVTERNEKFVLHVETKNMRGTWWLINISLCHDAQTNHTWITVAKTICVIRFLLGSDCKITPADWFTTRVGIVSNYWVPPHQQALYQFEYSIRINPGIVGWFAIVFGVSFTIARTQ